MFSENTTTQSKAEFVIIDDLVPEDHLLRKIQENIDFTFINEICRPYYSSDNGRPAIEPKVLFKMLLIGYLYGIRSERRLVEEIKVNCAYRWFLGYGLSDKIPDVSVIWQNRVRRFNGTDVVQKIFDRIVEEAYDLGFISGKVLYTDSTHLKANASKTRFVNREVEASVSKYLDDLDAEVNSDRTSHGKAPFDKKDDNGVPKTKNIKSSLTDPDSGFMHRDRKPLGFFYLEHRTVDSAYNIVTDVFVTPGNTNDVTPYIDRLDHQIERFGFDVCAVGLDAGYNTVGVCRELARRDIKAAVGTRRGTHQKGRYGKYKFVYIPEWDVYICPERCYLEYVTTARDGMRTYRAKKRRCQACERRAECLAAKQKVKVVMRHIWEDYKDRAYTFTHTPAGKRIYARRKETIERSFADAKELHGMRYARMRGISKVQEQCLLTAVAQNIKKMAMVLSKRASSFLDFPAFFANLPSFLQTMRKPLPSLSC
jgi:transposase